jgi:hypothetical protein
LTKYMVILKNSHTAFDSDEQVMNSRQQQFTSAAETIE